MKSKLGKTVLFAAAWALLPLGVQASSVGSGQLFYNGTVVRTLVPPASAPQEGTDPFFKVTNGVPGQLGIAAVAPGAIGYHGGHWAVNTVTFKPGVAPRLLTSEADVMNAEAAGMVTVMRVPAADFLCPIQP